MPSFISWTDHKWPTVQMADRTGTSQSSTSAIGGQHESTGARIVPVSAPPIISMSPPSPVDHPMEMNSPENTSTSTSTQAADHETNGKINIGHLGNVSSQDQNSANSNSTTTNMPAPPPAAAAAVHQPKIVQTAFIHKLYNMLEDSSIQHLISWSSSAESFVMSPSADFSKVLSQYFKHTNISSFVRQLNMYGFHKERDVFHTGNPETTLWEFKHGNGNFKRGDLVGLREIKRRASRHALVNRETNFTKAPSQPGTPAEPVPMTGDSTEARLSNLEHAVYDMTARLQRSEDSAHYMSIKHQAAMDTINRLLHFNQELSKGMLSLVPADSPIHRDVLTLQTEMQRQAEVFRTFEDTRESPPYAGRQQFFNSVDNAPVSPRQLPQDDSRRVPLGVPQSIGKPTYRPAVPSNLSIGSRRPFGSISGGAGSSPLRNAAPPPPPGPHPLSNVEPSPASLARRHTAADIRAHGWQPSHSPFSASNPPPPAWPSSPSRVLPEDQRIRDSLSQFSLQPTSSHAHPQSRPTTPPSHFSNHVNSTSDTFGSWSWNSASNRDSKGLGLKDSSAPPTRRGSMAHILNPSDTAERSDEDEDPRGEDDRKRKRRQ
ncbi:Transcription factor SFL1 [Cladobotryum mycophilum]|uniref:Transcription factor SFL1 n=1 Tax=Cladobotryum mycophilum TaxID=491253 RepID=A0ABR0SYY3_9HYPO